MAVATATAVTASASLPSQASRGEFYNYSFLPITIPPEGIPVANVYLYYGQTTLAEIDFYRAYDPRQLFSATSNATARTQIATKTANYTLITVDYTVLVDASGGAVTITLPPAASAYSSATKVGNIYNVKRIDSSGNAVTVDGNGANIDGSPTLSIPTQWMSFTFQSNGTAWLII